MHRVLFVSLLTAAVAGCDGSSSTNPLPDSLKGSFMIIEGLVGDLYQTMNAPTYRPDPTLGTDSDRIGMSLIMFQKNAAGTRLAEDADAINKKFGELNQLAQSKAPIAKQREAVKALKDMVDATKAKL